MKLWRFLWLPRALALFVFCGCGKAKQSDVPGKYVANHSYGTELIELNADHTYRQVFTSGPTSLTNTGQWAFHPPVDWLDGSSVGLKDAWIFGDGEKAEQIRKVYWSLDVAVYPSGARLEFGDSMSFSRVK